jgi:four helix bundle protein
LTSAAHRLGEGHELAAGSDLRATAGLWGSHRPLAGGGESRRAERASNDPEVTMPNALANTNLIAHEKALAAAGDAISLVLRVPPPLKSIADQVIRSAGSVPANLAEGHGRSGRDRVHFWRIAYASAKEVDSHLRLLERAGVVNSGKAERVLENLDQVRAMTWRLINPKT